MNDRYLPAVHVLHSGFPVEEEDIVSLADGADEAGVIELTQVGALCSLEASVDQRIRAGEVGYRRCVQLTIWKKGEINQ